jgi:nucleoside-diphosphate-sugar epimerase
MNSKNDLQKRKEKICVTGANGFLGKALVNGLSRDGYEVLALSRKKASPLSEKESKLITYISGDIATWESALAQYQPGYVISCDWEGVEKGDRDNQTQELNIERILRLGNAVVNVKARGFLVFGSQAEVDPAIHPILENAEVKPQSEYGRTKSILHEKLKFLTSETETKLIWGRIFTIYGPGDQRNSLITEGIKRNLAGDVFVIQNPGLKWSFLYVDDFVSAVQTIIEESDIDGIINIGNPEVDELIKVEEALVAIHQLPLKNQSTEGIAHSDDQPTWIPDTQKLLALGWTPQISLNQGIAKTVEWWRSADFDS